MMESPLSWKPITSAPRDGTFVRLRLFKNHWEEDNPIDVGQWQPHEEMKTGGAWFDRDGCYICGGATGWLPEHGSVN